MGERALGRLLNVGIGNVSELEIDRVVLNQSSTFVVPWYPAMTIGFVTLGFKVKPPAF